MKCPECASEFVTDSTAETIACPNCNKQINVDRAIKYYQSLNKINSEKNKATLTEVYQKLTAILDKCQYFIDNGNFEEALKVTDVALNLYDNDGRVYMMRVYAKTKNFTDFEEETHFYDLKKALELSTTLEKEEIKKIYAPYHRKRNIPKEEFEEYENQESISRLIRVEKLLKDRIPNNFSREKFVKSSFPFLILSSSVFLILLVLSLVLNNTVLSLVSALFLVVFILLLSFYLNTKSKAKRFNAVLDLYDGLTNFNLTPKERVNLSIVLEKFAVAEANNENTNYVETLLFQIVEILLLSENQNAIQFIKNNDTFKKYE